MEWGSIVASVLILAIVIGISNRLGRLERRLGMLLRQLGIDPNQTPPLSERVKELARQPARKIEAIKAYRDETGASLAEAKAAVEAFMANQ